MGGEFDFLMEDEETLEDVSNQLIDKATAFLESEDDTYGGLDAERLKKCICFEETENIENKHVIFVIDYSNIIIKSGARLKELIIPDFVEEIRSQDSLINLVRSKYIEHVVIPSSVRVIADGTFANYIRLKKVTIENESKLSKIGHDAFLNCEKLKQVDLSKCEYLEECV